MGHNQNTGSMVYVNGGTFIMNNGATITGNIRAEANSGGGGVYVNSGTFTMNGGAISGNRVNSGGGVCVVGGSGSSSGTFTMNGGTISGNTANSNGGGVFVDRGTGSSGTFTLIGGTISGNTASQGGGVYVAVDGFWRSGTFTMRGGAIIGNTATAYGGGVHTTGRTNFTKTGGIITGYSSDQANGNRVADQGGIIARRGHGVWVSENRRKETTAGPSMSLNNSNDDNWGDIPTTETYNAADYAPSVTYTVVSEPSFTVENVSATTPTTVESAPNVTSVSVVMDEPALLHIYRRRNRLDILPTRYDIFLDNVVVGNSTNNWKTTATVTTSGMKTVSATIDGRRVEVRINFESGGVYYVRSDVDSKTIDTGRTRTTTNRDGTTRTTAVTEIQHTPILQIVDKSVGESEFNAIR